MSHCAPNYHTNRHAGADEPAAAPLVCIARRTPDRNEHCQVHDTLRAERKDRERPDECCEEKRGTAGGGATEHPIRSGDEERAHGDKFFVHHAEIGPEQRENEGAGIILHRAILHTKIARQGAAIQHPNRIVGCVSGIREIEQIGAERLVEPEKEAAITSAIAPSRRRRAVAVSTGVMSSIAMISAP